MLNFLYEAFIFEKVLFQAANWELVIITVNYTSSTSSLVDKMIATKSSNSKVVKGVLITT